jgi:hypothetical protein
MKHLPIITLLLLSTLCACQKSNTEGPADLFNGKKLEGKWTPVTTTIVIKYNDGSVQNVTVAGEPGEYLEFKDVKTTTHKAEGLFTQAAIDGTLAEGKWLLAQDKAEIDFTYTSTQLFKYRRIDELDDHKLIMSADDKMILLFFEVNDLNINGQKKVIGGSAFEEFKR